MTRLPRTPVLVPALAAVVLAALLLSPSVSKASVGEERKRPEGTRAPQAVQPKRAVPSIGQLAARHALTTVGVRYRYGGETPAGGFDCSGLVRWAYGRLGVELPHSSYALASIGRSVTAGRLQPGDVLLFAGLGHVGLYLGRGRMVHAPQSGRSVEIVALGGSSYGMRLVGARRIVPA